MLTAEMVDHPLKAQIQAIDPGWTLIIWGLSKTMYRLHYFIFNYHSVKEPFIFFVVGNSMNFNTRIDLYNHLYSQNLGPHETALPAVFT